MDVYGTFLDKTHQKWIFTLIDRWLPLTFLATLLLARGHGISVASLWVPFEVLLLLLVGAAYTWGAYSIRCPTCRTRLYNKLRRELGMFRFTHQLIRLTECPVCGTDWSSGSGAQRQWQPEPRYWTLKRITLAIALMFVPVALFFITALITERSLPEDGRQRQKAQQR